MMGAKPTLVQDTPEHGSDERILDKAQKIVDLYHMECYNPIED